jgi:hypothetical protein
LDLCNVLNYLEGIGIGINEGLYDKDIVRAYLGTIIVGTVEEYITSGIAARAERDGVRSDPDEFARITELAKEWRNGDAET